MIPLLFKKGIREFKTNIFLNFVTIVTIGLSVLIFSAFLLLYINAGSVLKQWIKDIRIMAYLDESVSKEQIKTLRKKIESIPYVRKVKFISKDNALEIFKKQLKNQASLVEGMKENPLPHAFEIYPDISGENWTKTEIIAKTIKAYKHIETVEYGKEWLARFVNIMNLFRLTGYGLGGLLFMATSFFMANTIRLVLYSRRDEIEIMRLVGATDGFIKDPFYIHSLLMGITGGISGLLALFLIFRLISPEAAAYLSGTFVYPEFLPVRFSAGILAGSVFVGWLGCFFSLRQFLKS